MASGADKDSRQSAIDRLTWAFRSLEERARSNRPVLGEVTFFLGALDRALAEEERAYAAMVFAAQKEARDELTVLLSGRFSLPRGEVIAGLDEHLRSTFGPEPARASGSPLQRHLEEIRAQVLSKAARLL